MSLLFLESLGSGEPLVLFHGWGCDNRVWRSILPFLTQRYLVVLVDLPGFGQSAWMSFEDFKASLFTHLPPTFQVLGWSLGGLYAMRLAIEHPEKITHLTCVSSSPKIIADKDWPGIEKRVWADFIKQFQLNPQATCDTFFKLHLRQKGLHPAPLNPEHFQKGLSILEGWDLREALHQVKTGSFMFGGRDEIISPKTYDKMKTLYPQFQMTLFPQAGHSVFLSHPDLFLKAL